MVRSILEPTSWAPRGLEDRNGTAPPAARSSPPGSRSRLESGLDPLARSRQTSRLKHNRSARAVGWRNPQVLDRLDDETARLEPLHLLRSLVDFHWRKQILRMLL